MIQGLLATARITKRRGVRNLTLRVCPRYGHLKLTVPWRTSQKAVQAFVAEHAAWIATQKAKTRAAQTVAHEASILWQGENYIIHHHPTARGVEVLPDDNTKILHVHCPEPRLLRAVQRFYQQQALLGFSELAYQKAGILQKPIKQITVRDTTSRWGSCSRDGKLSFSWRLIMAPQFVQDYVVAHEVAHLAHFNHSDEFWACCQSLSADMSAAKIWIRRHGPLLQCAWGT